ncbi:unnamed protein product [Euphydryas editha]|uniref:Uncharacterized protein n=1 Tax=Euphydryas editha TaxID=104508 RepID=A0AAU9UVE5_EUPED|nr:unnamed protein product [Euphydryas editha]
MSSSKSICDAEACYYICGVFIKSGYTKHMCYLYLWDRYRADAQHYVQRLWPLSIVKSVGKQNVKSEPIAEPENILMPLLHIKLRSCL